MFGGDAGARYDVEVNLKKAGAGWDDLSAGASKFADKIDSLGSKMVGLSMGAVFAGGAAAIAAVTWGVASLNKEAENASISMAAIFNANGVSNGLNQGLSDAADTIKTMRKDVASLPVEFRDLQNVFKTTAIPLFQAGATREQAEKFAVKASATGAVMEVDPAMVARESAMLLAGRAGSHNRFGTMLGFSGAKAKELNAADPTKRLAMVTTELDKYSGALALFAHSFQGLETTMIDHGKNFARLATAPVFEAVKDTMEDINNWFTKNQQAISDFANDLGIGIRDAFLWGKKEIIEWWPLVSNFASAAWTELVSIWERIEPYVTSFAGAMRDALADPQGTIGRLEHLFELYAAVKIGGGLLSGGGAAWDIAKGTGTMLQAGMGAAGSGLMTVGGTGAAGMMASTVGGTAVGATAVGAVFLAAVAAWGVAIYEAVDLAHEVHAQDMANAVARAEAHGRDIEEMIKAGASAEDLAKKQFELAATYEGTEDAFGNVTSFGDAAGWALNDVAVAAALAAANLDQISKEQAEQGSKRMDAAASEAKSNLDQDALQRARAFNNGWKQNDRAVAKAKPVMKGGHGGTSIQKVEIVVTSNQSPSRIARQVHSELAKLSNNRKISKYVPNYSALDEE